MGHSNSIVWWIISLAIARIIAMDEEDIRKLNYWGMRSTQAAARLLGEVSIEFERRYWELTPYGR